MEMLSSIQRSLRRYCLSSLYCRRAVSHSSTSLSSDSNNDGDGATDGPVLIVEQCDKIRMLGLNRPSKRNALNTELISALRLELGKLEEDDGTIAGIIYGMGGNFCSGIDLEDVDASIPKLPLVDEYCRKPIVASISGYAVGEGFDLAMACDIRVMEETAVIGVFNRRFGVPMCESAVSRLVACVGLSIALDLILTGRPIDAAEALSKGLITRHVPCGAGRGEAITAAQQLVKYPQAALLADRAALYKNILFSEEFIRALNQERDTQLSVAHSDIQVNSKRFFEGVGKHGTFKNLFIDRKIPHWMN